jgi:hypothetical protein
MSLQAVLIIAGVIGALFSALFLLAPAKAIESFKLGAPRCC